VRIRPHWARRFRGLLFFNHESLNIISKLIKYEKKKLYVLYNNRLLDKLPIQINVKKDPFVGEITAVDKFTFVYQPLDLMVASFFFQYFNILKV
jgi:hypothetical protein